MLRDWGQAWRPRPRHGPAEWVAKHLRLPLEFGATAGGYDLDRHSYCRGVLEAADDPSVATIALQWATQLGKTTLLQAILAWFADSAPCPAMLAGPDKDFTLELRDKFYALCEATPRLAGRVPPENERNSRWIDLRDMVCYLAWSGNTQRLSGKATKLVLCTEVDRWRRAKREGASTRLIGERVKAFFRYLIIYEGAPTDDASTIAGLYEASDRRVYQVPCPACGHYQELRFFPHRDGPHAGRGGVVGLQDEQGRWRTADQVLEEAVYCCEAGGCRITSRDKPDMVRRGVWVPRGQRVEVVAGEPRLVGQPEQSSRHAGFYLNSLYADSLTFGRVAAEYLNSREEDAALQSFINNWLGLKHSTRRNQPQWKRIGRRLAAGHSRGTVPAAAYFLTAGADVQSDRVYWIVRAWGDNSTSWLVDWGCLRKRIDAAGQVLRLSDLDQLDAEVLDRFWPVVGGKTPWGHEQLQVRLACIDSRHRTADVHAFKSARPGDYIRPIEGMSKDKATTFDFYRVVERDRNATTGEVYAGRFRVHQLNVTAYKEDVRDRWEAPLENPGAWFLTAGIVEDGQDYLRQICNEVPVTAVSKTGHHVRQWQVVDHRLGEHYWDCEIYARAAADMVTEGDFGGLADPAPSSPPTPPRDDTASGRFRRLTRRRRG